MIALGATSATALWFCAPIAGQAPAARARTEVAPAKPVKSWKAPRTADGQPDLQGVWDFRVVTPMERPTELAGKQILTEAEAAKFEEQASVRNNRDRNVPAGNVGDYNEFWYDRGKKLTDSKRTSLVVDPPDGKIPPLTPEAQRRQAAATEARRGVGTDEPTPGGWVEDLGSGGLRVRCLLGFNSGPPMTPGAYNNNFQLFQTPEYVVILNEMVHNARMVPMDGRPHGSLRRWAGDSRGRWEGDTLVVDTTNFTDKGTGLFVLQYQGDENAHVVERFKRLDANTLLYEFTLTDPTIWTKPFSGSFTMTKTTEKVYEYACHEGNYGMVNILAGARADEKAGRKPSCEATTGCRGSVRREGP
jgi:hypothetical protein